MKGWAITELVAKKCICLLTDLVVVVGLKTTERPVVNHLTMLLPSTCAKAKHSGAFKVKASPGIVMTHSTLVLTLSLHPLGPGLIPNVSSRTRSASRRVT